VRAAPRGVVVAGPAPAPRAAAWRAAAQRFLAASGYVLLAEATSQLRFGLDDAARARCTGAFDALLRSPALRRRLRPQLALEIGAPAVSAQWLAWCDGDDAPARWVLPGERPADPAGGALGMVLGPAAALLDAAAAALEAQPGPAAAAADTATYAAAWRVAEDAAWRARSQVIAMASRPDEAAVGRRSGAVADGAAETALQEHEVAPLLRAALPPGSWLAIGNSSPVRDLDHDLPPDGQALTLLHQRGAAGIDGGVAGAAGARSVLAAPMALLLGDVALLHDTGGLAAAAAVRGPLAIVVVHNDGGRIFERLPLGRDASLAGACEQLFVVPHGHGFDGLAATWGLAFARVDTAAALAQALARALAAERPILIEARVAPGGSARRAGLLAAMAQAADAAMGA
jgi:2-succinyl-5-enolpyruvyl-6-hydroxy-3-cyclohexene-1-carboxylate synthase